jgi:hypothetical protein
VLVGHLLDLIYKCDSDGLYYVFKLLFTIKITGYESLTSQWSGEHGVRVGVGGGGEVRE